MFDSHLDDWEFHQATGMVAVQIGTCDMDQAACQLLSSATLWGLSAHELAILVIDRQVALE